MYTPTLSRSSHRRRVALALFIVPAVLAVGCGDDDSESISSAACDAAVDFGAAFGEAPDDPSQFTSFATERLVPIGVTLVANLEGDAHTAATTLSEAFDEIAATGDLSSLERPDVAAARATLGAAIHDGCDLQAVEIGAIEYAYVDTPSTLDAGRVSFALRNDGVEAHEMVLFRRADGVVETLDELMALPEDELFSKVEFTGVTFGDPGSINHVAVDLEPGTYFLVCFIPQGGADDGPPHFMAGMQQTIVVT
jgi:hypothetical protein